MISLIQTPIKTDKYAVLALLLAALLVLSVSLAPTVLAHDVNEVDDDDDDEFDDEDEIDDDDVPPGGTSVPPVIGG